MELGFWGRGKGGWLGLVGYPLLLLIDIHVCGYYPSYMMSLGDFHVVVVVGSSERMNKRASEQVS